jgi:glucokinase
MRGGIDLGGTKIQAVVVDSRSKVRGDARLPTPGKGGPPDVVAAMAEAMAQAAQAAGVDAGELSGVGVGSPGAVDAEAGTVASASHQPGGTDEP